MPYRYTMVTTFDKHWDELGENEASYPLRMLKGETASDDIFVENTPATFVRLNGSTLQPEGVWEGKVYAFRKTPSRVFFKVKLDKVLPTEPKYKLESGWYVQNVAVVNPTLSNQPKVSPPSTKIVQSELRPAIFDELLQTKDWKKFEQYTYYLIKLLGIHNAYRFDPDNQSGKADGFFKFNNLAVIYDCTLRDGFEEHKRAQMENYCKQLETGRVEAASKVVEEFHHHQKQVWIITRGRSRVIEVRNDIAIKEINVERLIDLYEYRLRNDMGANQLENELRSIEADTEN